jgi:hypothetical protein
VTPGSQRESSRRNPRSRSNTAHSYGDRYREQEDPVEPEAGRPSIRSAARVQSTSRLNTHQEYPDSPTSPARPQWGRSQTFEGPTSINRTTTPVNGGRKPSINADPGMLRMQLRPSNRINTSSNVFGDPSDASTNASNSPDHSYRERSVSPATSHGSVASRNASYTTVSSAATTGTGRKGPPPPPPARAKKPPPPPPMKRAAISEGAAGRY